MNRRQFFQWLGVAPVVAALPDMPVSGETGWRISEVSSEEFHYTIAHDYANDPEWVHAAEGLNPKHPKVIDYPILLSSDFVAPLPGFSTNLIVEDMPTHHVERRGELAIEDGSLIQLRKLNRLDNHRLFITNCWGVAVLDKDYGINGFDPTTGTQGYIYRRFRAESAGDMLAGSVVSSEAIALNYGNWINYEDSL